MTFNPVDATEQHAKAKEHFAKILAKKIPEISRLSGVPQEKLIPINPADFVEKNPYIEIRGHKYQEVGDYIAQQKRDDTYLISPMDDNQLSANQISFKEHINTERIRASKCEVVPIHAKIALHFFQRNHRQTLPRISQSSVSFALVYAGQIVGVMTYDKTAGGVRGHSHANYELLRLAFAHGKQIMGGASKLQKACEATMIQLGESEIFSYSNATINSGKVYAALGFTSNGVQRGQPFVIVDNFQLKRMLELTPFTSTKALARRKWLETHIGGNITWTKSLK